MTHAEKSAQSLPRKLPVQAVLGIIDPDDGDWPRLRGLQFANLALTSSARLAAHAFAAIATVLLFLGTVHWALLLVWLVLLAGALTHAVRFDHTLADADRRRVSQDEATRQIKNAMLVAIVWMVPIGFFGFSGDAVIRLELWAIISLLMTVTAIVLPAVPLSTLMFSGIVGFAIVMNFILKGEFGMAALALAYGAVVTVGAIQAARNYLVARALLLRWA